MTAAQNQIDTTRLAVSGCSYAGKMALYVGAFDERIALTIPEAFGGGGEASCRVMAKQPDTEDLEEAQGTGWYSSNLRQFRNPDAPKLPFDQHSLVAMAAPRTMLAIENPGIARLGGEASGASMQAAAEVYAALGVPDRIGFSQAQASSHCAFPSSQTADVEAFVDKFRPRGRKREHLHRERFIQHRPVAVDHLGYAHSAIASEASMLSSNRFRTRRRPRQRVAESPWLLCAGPSASAPRWRKPGANHAAALPV